MPLGEHRPQVNERQSVDVANRLGRVQRTLQLELSLLEGSISNNEMAGLEEDNELTIPKGI